MMAQITVNLDNLYQRNIISKKSYIKLALIEQYGEKLEKLIDKERNLLMSLEEIESFADCYSIPLDEEAA